MMRANKLVEHKNNRYIIISYDDKLCSICYELVDRTQM